jgi:dephospho-CoA kinase
MQKLTARGMRLAQRFRELGVPVIESYPGAAQDIMGIPRKGASIEYLAKGLELFGIKGDYIHQKVTHDELDAITSAAVGLFFWSGKFEAIGNEEEDYLIIPDLDVDPASWLNRKVIGLSGPIASGKTTAGRFFESKGFTYGRFSQVIKNIVEKKGLEANRENLQAAGEEINKYKGQRWLGRELCKLLKDSENLVIDGLRHPEDHAFMIETFGASYHHVSIIAPLDIRRKRYIANESSENAFANAITHPVEQNVDKVAALADSVIENTSDLSSFKARLEKIIELKLGDHT